MIFFFRKKLKSLVDVKAVEKRMKEEPLDLEKGDIPAIIIAGFVVMAPIFLCVIGALLLLYLLFQ